MPPSCPLFEAQERAEILQSRKQPTLPTTLEKELTINPFLQAVDLAQFITLRQQKDQA